MPTHSSLLLLVTLWASVQDGLGLPVVKQAEPEAIDGARTHPVRTKRCACSNPEDTECTYFCHLDIIWVNTPSKTTVYGLGGGLQRRKRFAGRCTCARLDEKTCTSFCYLRCEHQNSPAEALRTRGRRRVCKSPEIQSEKRPQLDILSILRDAVHNSKRALDTGHSGRELLFQAQRKNA